MDQKVGKPKLEDFPKICSWCFFWSEWRNNLDSFVFSDFSCTITRLSNISSANKQGKYTENFRQPRIIHTIHQLI